MNESSLFNQMYQPDVLTCLADLSNDEVFTPPTVANAMLDLLPKEIWHDPSVKILDPACKTGVFLREAAKRFIEGEKDIFPDLQERVNHIFHEQLFGIGITEITSLISRRSVYCSKYPNSLFSVTYFDTPVGNILYHNIQHTWKNGTCIFCGAAESQYKRNDGKESYAYEFIHTDHPEEIWNMKFDVIIGNPPYQLSDGGGEGSSATPIYNKFIEQAIKLNPKYISMIVPARWYSGGKGLDAFRDMMLHDKRLSIIHDFPETADCFPGLNIRGGVCYFLWDSNHSGNATVYDHKNNSVDIACRPLLENKAATFIRYNKAIEILHKVQSFGEETMDSRVQSRNYYGIPSNFSQYSTSPTASRTIPLYRSDRNPSSPKYVYINKKDVMRNFEDIYKMKVIVSKASPGGDEYPHAIISKPIISESGSACTETYLIVDFVEDEVAANSLVSYMSTKFFRFMMSLIKNTQNISKGVFGFTPVQKWDHIWTDEELYSKYNITEKEQEFINSMIKPMDLGEIENA